MSRLDSSTLQMIALEKGGIYQILSSDDQDLEMLLNQSPLESEYIEDGTDKILLKSGLSLDDLASGKLTITTATGGTASGKENVSTGDYLIFEIDGGTRYLLIIKRSGSLTIDSDDFVNE